MRSVCVFCGSKTGKNPAYVEASRALGRLLVKENIELVYGGGSIGLMGTVATEVMSGGGTVIGVIPQFLDDMEVGHKGITELVLVDSMHERKQKMESLSEGVIALPGGFGTLEELAEIITWAQLKLVKKPMGLLNVAGYYDPLLRFFDHMVAEGFVGEKTRDLVISAESPEMLLAKMNAWEADSGRPMMKRNQT